MPLNAPHKPNIHNALNIPKIPTIAIYIPIYTHNYPYIPTSTHIFPHIPK